MLMTVFALSHRNVLRKVVQVRLYNLRTDYDSIDVLSMQLEENGNLNLITVARQFGSQRECRVSGLWPVVGLCATDLDVDCRSP